MISSRCNDRFPIDDPAARRLSDIRSEIKTEVEAETVLGQQVYEVWINEKESGDSGQQAWDHCLDQAADCDIFIALFNGNAGWPDMSGTVGICHAEFEKAQSLAPGKVFIINIHEAAAKNAPKEQKDLDFQDYVKRLRRFEARAARDEEQLRAAVRRTVPQATIKMVQRGVRDAGRGTNYIGPALDWSRRSYAQRASAMRAEALAGLGGVNSEDGENSHVRKVDKKDILFVVSAIPDAMSVAAAREIVGQPHLDDHLLWEKLAGLNGGPVHLVACHKGVTKSQARAMLGFPDATIVAPPFGIYVADPVQSIQLVLIAQCRDETSTRQGVQRFLEWLDETEQSSRLVDFAAKRRAVVKALAR